MKKIILLFTALLVCSLITVKAQKYHYNTNEIDPISGKRHREISLIIANYSFLSVEHWYLGLDRNGDDFQLISNLVFDKQVLDDIAKGDSLIIKLDNNKLVKCYSSSSRPRKEGYISKVFATMYISYYPLSIDDVKLLASAKAVFIRIYIGATHHEKEIKDKNAIDLKNSAKIILTD